MADREAMTNALRFWETGRLYYNMALLLAVTAAIWVVAEEVGATLLDLLPTFIFAAIVANLVYCAAYPIDLLVQSSAYKAAWRQWRWVLWLAGTMLAIVLALVMTSGGAMFNLGPGD